MTPVTLHFAREEFACHNGEVYPPEWIADRLTPLCQTLEVIREAIAAPVRILSGYRTPTYNAGLTGAAKDSQHMYGRAADIRVDTVDSRKLHTVVLALHAAGKLPMIGGLGSYPGWVHVDVRPIPDGRLRRWTI